MEARVTPVASWTFHMGNSHSPGWRSSVEHVPVDTEQSCGQDIASLVFTPDSRRQQGVQLGTSGCMVPLALLRGPAALCRGRPAAIVTV